MSVFKRSVKICLFIGFIFGILTVLNSVLIQKPQICERMGNVGSACSIELAEILFGLFLGLILGLIFGVVIGLTEKMMFSFFSARQPSKIHIAIAAICGTLATLLILYLLTGFELVLG